MLNQKINLAASLFLLSFVFLNCDSQSSTSPTAQPTASQETLEQEVIQLRRELNRLSTRVNSITSGSALVDTEDKGYTVAQTKYGSFTVACRNLTPYLDGYKVTVAIGNLTSAQFNGAKINLQWGSDFSKTKEMGVTSSFLPGRNTNLEFIMTPAKPEDIKIFYLTLEFNQIVLY